MAAGDVGADLGDGDDRRGGELELPAVEAGAQRESTFRIGDDRGARRTARRG